ncbi:hypothetical protein AB0E10_17310 [Streptomyces sp. NPDC048045]|uniref:hypothetical protein n=1 Tax=Streptomyces sp. NPDC048045 TaxID=3154710 RepID=UPI00343AF52E
MPPHLRQTLAAIAAYEGPGAYDGFLAALGGSGRGAAVSLEGSLRYERAVDFVDPPHTAKARLTGEAVARLEEGIAITAVVNTPPR